MASGEELLIADTSERDREGLRKLFDSQGYVCTVSRDVRSAQELVQRKFFPAAIVDLDFGSTGGGLDLIRFIQKHSSPTKVILLAGRRSFEEAVDALRLGVVDVVSKRPDQIELLKAAVAKAIDRYRAGDGEGALLSEVRSTMEDAFRIILSMARKVYGESGSSSSGVTIKPAILLIDEDQKFLQEVAGLLTHKQWEVSVELSGGSGLDKASTFAFQIVAVREQLMDLPGQMVLKSAQSQQTKTLGLLYGGGDNGHIDRYEGGQRTSTAPFATAADLVDKLDELVQEIAALTEERRYMTSFRADHGRFLKRFAELKVRIDSSSE